jgi:hypothetical protein
MGKFGWSLPAGCSTLPGEEPEEPIGWQCRRCGHFHPGTDPEWGEDWEQVEIDDAGQEWIIAAGTVLFYKCSSCGFESDWARWIDAGEEP